MDLKSDYVKYALQASFSITAVIALYLVDPVKPLTFLYLLTVPLLFAYTAYISTESFQRPAVLSLIALVFMPLGIEYSALAVFVATGNIFVSFFSAGDSFRSFYSTASLPLLFAGVIVGVTVFATLSASPQQTEQLSNTISDNIADQTEKMMEYTGLERGAQEQLITTVATVTVTTTQAYVMNETTESLSPNEIRELSDVFENARGDVPDMIAEEASERTPDTHEIADTVVSTVFTGKMLLLTIPLLAMSIYALHPVVGLSMAFFGVLMRRTDSYLAETN